MMVQLKTYTNDTLPEAYAHQICDFVRMLWYDNYKNGTSLPVSPDELQPVYHVMVEGRALYSSATVVRRRINHAGVDYMCYGLSSVLTYPYFRKRGYGRRVVDSATELIKAAPDADIAWLQTGPDLEAFYGPFGWTYLPELQLLSGDPDQPEPRETFSMMLFVSPKGQQARPIVEKARLYLGPYLW